jgi:hypothetical protein
MQLLNLKNQKNNYMFNGIDKRDYWKIGVVALVPILVIYGTYKLITSK